jgi:hypothetical protein
MSAILALGAIAVAGVAAGMATTATATDPGPPNQGDPDKVFAVLSGYQCSGTVHYGPKIEGGLGVTISFSASSPIVKVTIKSGEKASLVSATWAADYLSGTITITQNVSNYVVWTCSGGTTTDTTTTGTTETTTTGTTETTTTGTTETTTTGTTETTTTGTTETTTTGTTETTTTGTTETTTTGTTETETTETETTPLVPLTPPVVPEADEEAAPADEPAAPLTPPATPEESGVAGVATPQLAYTP